jgi:hypothetical protein
MKKMSRICVQVRSFEKTLDDLYSLFKKILFSRLIERGLR